MIRLLMLGFSATLLAPASLAASADTPRDRYELDRGCASIMIAAGNVSGVAASDLPAEKESMRTITTATHDRAVESGAKLKLSRAQVETAIAEGADGIVAKISEASDPAAAEKEKHDLGRVMLSCGFAQTMRR